jgi:nitroreductase
METWEAIRSRRNVREFADRPVAPDAVDRILEAGRLAPSARNWQPWDFIVVTDRDKLAELAGVWQGAWHVANAPAAIALVAPIVDDDRWRELLQYDLGHATMAMLLAAADLGIGTGHASVADQDLARRILGFPDDRFCAYLVSLGDPAGGPLTASWRPNRRPFEEVVHRERWSLRLRDTVVAWDPS